MIGESRSRKGDERASIAPEAREPLMLFQQSVFRLSYFDCQKNVSFMLMRYGSILGLI